MSRQQEALALAEALLTDVELSQTSTSKRVMKAMRLARLLRDETAQEWLTYEVDGVPGTAAGRAWMSRTRRWSNPEKTAGYWGAAAHVEAVRDSSAEARAALAGSVSLSGDLVALAMRERTKTINTYTTNTATMQNILAAVDAAIYQYAGDTYAELQFSELQASLFDSSRVAVDATMLAMAGDALKKIESVNERLQTGDVEAISQAMTTCRRLIDAAADHLFIARDEPYDLDGTPVLVKQGNVLNRLSVYLHSVGVRGGRGQRLRRACKDLYERVSAGVHSDITIHEARYLFLLTYVLLGEILTLRASTFEAS